MAMGVPSIDEFRSNLIALGGPSKSNRFLVQIGQPGSTSGLTNIGMGNPLTNLFNQLTAVLLPGLVGNSPGLLLQCESTEIPGVTLNTNDVKIYGPSSKFPFQRTYNDWTANFIVTNSFSERLFFDTWMDQINPVETFDWAYKDDYTTTICVYQFDEGGSIGNGPGAVAGGFLEFALGQPNNSFISTPSQLIYQVDILEAFPIAVNSMPVSWADENFHRLSVTFAYRYWDNPNSGPALGSSPTNVLSSLGIPSPTPGSFSSSGS